MWCFLSSGRPAPLCVPRTRRRGEQRVERGCTGSGVQRDWRRVSCCAALCAPAKTVSSEQPKSRGVGDAKLLWQKQPGGPSTRPLQEGGRARAGTARLGARSVPGGCGWGAAPGTALRAPFCQHAPRSYIGARSCGGQLWFPDNAVVSVEDAHFQSQPCICFSCGRSF